MCARSHNITRSCQTQQHLLEGRLLLSVKGPARRKRLNPRGLKPNLPLSEPWVYQTEKVLHNRLGEWAHLVTVFDQHNKRVRHYVDERKIVEHKLRNRYNLSIDKAEVGNWPRPDKGHPATNLRGRMDELAVYKDALPEEEILQLYEVGRPNALHGWVAAREE